MRITSPRSAAGPIHEESAAVRSAVVPLDAHEVPSLGRCQARPAGSAHHPPMPRRASTRSLHRPVPLGPPPLSPARPQASPGSWPRQATDPASSIAWCGASARTTDSAHLLHNDDQPREFCERSRMEIVDALREFPRSSRLHSSSSRTP